jgi:hypothetical protein
MALLVSPRCDSGIDRAAEESIDEAAKLKQVFRNAEQRRTRRRVGARLEICPLGRDQGLASVGQN